MNFVREREKGYFDTCCGITTYTNCYYFKKKRIYKFCWYSRTAAAIVFDSDFVYGFERKGTLLPQATTTTQAQATHAIIGEREKWLEIELLLV